MSSVATTHASTDTSTISGNSIQVFMLLARCSDGARGPQVCECSDQCLLRGLGEIALLTVWTETSCCAWHPCSSSDRLQISVKKRGGREKKNTPGSSALGRALLVALGDQCVVTTTSPPHHRARCSIAASQIRGSHLFFTPCKSPRCSPGIALSATCKRRPAASSPWGGDPTKCPPWSLLPWHPY